MQESPLGKLDKAKPVETPDELAGLVFAWFADCQAQLKFISSVPDDAAIKMTIDGVERALTDTERQIYLQGVATTAEIFKQLPFHAVEAEESNEQNSQDSGV